MEMQYSNAIPQTTAGSMDRTVPGLGTRAHGSATNTPAAKEQTATPKAAPPLAQDTVVHVNAGSRDGQNTQALEDALRDLERTLNVKGVALKFNLIGGGEMQVEVRDASSGKVIRKIPQDEAVRLAEAMRDVLQTDQGLRGTTSDSGRGQATEGALLDTSL